MKRYQKNRTEMTIKIILSLLLPFLAFISVPIIAGKTAEFTAVYIFALVLLYPLVVYIFFRKYIYSAYHNAVITEEDGFRCENIYLRGALVNAEVKYADVERIELFLPKIPMGTFALRVKVKNEELPVDIDNKYVNYENLWKTVCDKLIEKNPTVEIDKKIYEYVSKIKG